MSTISSVSSNLTSSIRGFGGLASGLDRDTLIEQFTAGTRSKIAQQKQKQQKLQWTQEAIRNITDKIYDFTNSFTSYSSSLLQKLLMVKFIRWRVIPTVVRQ